MNTKPIELADEDKTLILVAMQYHAVLCIVRDKLAKGMQEMGAAGYGGNKRDVPQEIIEAHAFAFGAIVTGTTAVPAILGEKGIVRLASPVPSTPVTSGPPPEVRG
jgi:hypothetical protein